MFNVFSNNSKTTEELSRMQQCAGSIFDRTLFVGPDDEPLYILKPMVIDVLKWVNQKILYELPKVKSGKNSQWVGVRIRIATNMLNNCVDKGILTKEMAIRYHVRLTSNVKKILGNIYTEDLPF